MFYLNTIEHLFPFVEQLDQLEVCIPSRLLTGIPILTVFQKSGIQIKNLFLLMQLQRLQRKRGSFRAFPAKNWEIDIERFSPLLLF